MPAGETLFYDDARRRRFIGAIVNGPINRIVRDMPVDVADYWDQNPDQLEADLRAALIRRAGYATLPTEIDPQGDRFGQVVDVVAV